MDVFKGENMLAFAKEFPDDDSCKTYLAQIKWDDGFICPKCAHNKGCKKAGVQVPLLPMWRLRKRNGRVAVTKGRVNHKSPACVISHLGIRRNIIRFFVTFPSLAYVFAPMGFIPLYERKLLELWYIDVSKQTDAELVLIFRIIGQLVLEPVKDLILLPAPIAQ